MSDSNKHENKTEEFLEKQEELQLTEEDLEQVTGCLAHDSERGVAPGIIKRKKKCEGHQ